MSHMIQYLHAQGRSSSVFFSYPSRNIHRGKGVAAAMRGSQGPDIASPWRGNLTAQEPSVLGDCRVA